MLTYDEALVKVEAAVPGRRAGLTPLKDCYGRILAEEIVAPTDLPPFTRSLVDGFALRSSDLARGWNRLRIIGEAAAGAPATTREIGPGECVRIMTGAPLPAGADAVQKFEETEQPEPLEVIIKESVDAGAHVLPVGSEIRRGAALMQPGVRLGATEAAVLAGLGREAVRTWFPPSVKIASTGDELTAPGRLLEPGQIFDSNGLMLELRARELGARTGAAERIGDDPQIIREFVDRATEDLLILTGGVSAGDYDYVHRILPEAGFEVVFHGVRIKPGKPVLLARRGDQLAFGLPGNPVSAAVTFELFVRTVIRRWSGFPDGRLPAIQARLELPLKHPVGRLFFRPGHLRCSHRHGWAATPARWISSSDLIGLASADCLIQIPAETTVLDAGDEVMVNVLDWYRPQPGHNLEND